MATLDDSDLWGVDLDWKDDLAPTGRLVRGFELLAQAVFHRLRTPRGACQDAPDDGLDLAEYLSSPMTPAQIASVPGEIRSELLKDERFVEADVTFTQQAPDAFRFRIQITPSVGPEFDLVIGVKNAAVKLLAVNEVSQ